MIRLDNLALKQANKDVENHSILASNISFSRAAIFVYPYQLSIACAVLTVFSSVKLESARPAIVVMKKSCVCLS